MKLKTLLTALREEFFHLNSSVILFGGQDLDGCIWMLVTGLSKRSFHQILQADEVCFHSLAATRESIIPFEQYSSFTRLLRVTAWIFHFFHNCSAHVKNSSQATVGSQLTVSELKQAESYLVLMAQWSSFEIEMNALSGGRQLPRSSHLISLRPFLDSSGLLRVGGREVHSALPFDRRHPIILHGNHLLAKLLIRREHLRLLLAGPTLLIASISRHYHIVGCRRIVRSITRSCTTCRRLAAISNPSVRVTIHYNLQDMYMHTRPPFVLQGMVALPSFIILDFCVCNFNLVWSDSSSAELWLLVDTHHDTRIRAEVSAILTFTHAKLAH